MKISVISSVKIDMNQKDLEQLILDKIKQEDDSINVDSIEFIQKRNPSRMAVDVKAHYGDLPVSEEGDSGDEDDEPVETATVEDIFDEE